MTPTSGVSPHSEIITSTLLPKMAVTWRAGRQGDEARLGGKGQ